MMKSFLMISCLCLFPFFVDAKTSAIEGKNASLTYLQQGKKELFKKEISKAKEKDISETMSQALVSEDVDYLKILLSQEKIKRIFKQNAVNFLPLSAQEGLVEHLKVIHGAMPGLFATPLANHQTILHLAVQSADLVTVKYIASVAPGLLNQLDDAGETALFPAARLGKRKIAEFLASQKEIHLELRNKQGFTASEVAAQEGFSKTAKLLTPKKSK